MYEYKRSWWRNLLPVVAGVVVGILIILAACVGLGTGSWWPLMLLLASVTVSGLYFQSYTHARRGLLRHRRKAWRATGRCSRCGGPWHQARCPR